MDMERHQVNPMGAKGPAAQQAPSRERYTGPEPVFGEGFDGIGGAARIEAAGRHSARGRCPISRERPHSPPRRPAHAGLIRGCCRAPAHAFTRCVAWLDRSRAWEMQRDRSAEVAQAAAGSKRNKKVPRGSSDARPRAVSRARRRMVLRTTALPQCLPIAYPNWGYTPPSWSSAATKLARTGPQLARD
jgi:hypothetical protein